MNKKDRRAIYMLAGAIDNLAMAVRDAGSPQVTEEFRSAVDRAQEMAAAVEESGLGEPVQLDEEEENDSTGRE